MINYPLREWMDRTGRTQSETAALLGVSIDFISKFVRGKRNISKKKCERLSEITGIPKQEIMFPDLYKGRA